MGAHTGHASLVNRAAFENDVVVVSDFVNPTQFNDKNDLLKYPFYGRRIVLYWRNVEQRWFLLLLWKVLSWTRYPPVQLCAAGYGDGRKIPSGHFKQGFIRLSANYFLMVEPHRTTLARRTSSSWPLSVKWYKYLSIFRLSDARCAWKTAWRWAAATRSLTAEQRKKLCRFPRHCLQCRFQQVTCFAWNQAVCKTVSV